MKKKTEPLYVTCAVCKNRYIGVIPKGGDGSILFPRKHSRYVIYNTNLHISMRIGNRERCPGSYQEAEE